MLVVLLYGLAAGFFVIILLVPPFVFILCLVIILKDTRRLLLFFLIQEVGDLFIFLDFFIIERLASANFEQLLVVVAINLNVFEGKLDFGFFDRGAREVVEVLAAVHNAFQAGSVFITHEAVLAP